MSLSVSLKEAERRAFRTKYDDGLWDILLGCFFLMFAIAPLLSASLGDFWSSVVFLPFWGLAYLLIWLVRRYVVSPRVGMVKFGPARRKKLMWFTTLMLVVNAIMLILGIVAAFSFGKVSGYLMALGLGLFLLFGCNLAAYLLDFPRLYVYGLMLGLSIPVGEWLFTHGYASHHGYPLTFGADSTIMILVGLLVFLRLLRKFPMPVEGIPPETA